MATAISINVTDKATDALKEQLARCSPPAVGKAIREDMVSEVRGHLAGLDESRPNQLGGRRTHFYERAADSVTHELTDSELRISITERGMRQRFLGGTIRPMNAKWITIPVRAEAHGKRAREFDNLRFIQISQDTALLIAAERTDVKLSRAKKLAPVSQRATRAGGEAMYILKKSVTQNPDPGVLPSSDRLGAVAVQSVSNYIAGGVK